MTDEIITSNPLKAELHVKGNGILRIVAIIITFLVWQSLTLLVLFLLSFHVLTFPTIQNSIQKLIAGLGIFGLAPVALAFFSWRIIEKILAAYMYSYFKKHLIR